MPGQRGENQKLLTVPADAEFIAELDRSLPKVHYANRSQFIRDAIVEKLLVLGIKMPKHLSLAPGRTPTALARAEKPSSPKVEKAFAEGIQGVSHLTKKKKP